MLERRETQRRITVNDRGFSGYQDSDEEGEEAKDEGGVDYGVSMNPLARRGTKITGPVEISSGRFG